MIKRINIQAGLDPGLMNITKVPVSFSLSIIPFVVSTSSKSCLLLCSEDYRQYFQWLHGD